MDASEGGRNGFTHPLLRPVVDFAGSWFRSHTQFITFHDPLAATTVFDPSVCEFAHGNVSVEMISPQLSGYTFWDRKAIPTRHEIATTVNVEKIFPGIFRGYSIPEFAFSRVPRERESTPPFHA